jgi:hypothetical protein
MKNAAHDTGNKSADNSYRIDPAPTDSGRVYSATV